ncbi:MAG: SurA N-terminal domain-containing protein [Rehaibacterium terrae]|uniref:SurA N-terminal domain-containing protein n=1 Tax=Rehaibacterium terrae TaxID=1341696 RepID=UPI00391CEBA6
MLQKLREKTTSGWLAFVIVGLLIIPFAFFGVNNYFSAQVATWVAKIEVPAPWWQFGKDTREISQDEFRSRFEQYRQRMRQTLGDAYDPRQFDDITVKRQVLDALIEEQLLLIAAERDGVVVPDAVVAREIMNIPAFQVDGRFDQTQYRLLLQSQGMTISGFERQLREDLVRQLLPNQIARSAFVSDADLDAFIRLRDQRRDIDYLALPVPRDVDETVTDEQVQAWYAERTDRYRSPERVTLEYVEIDASNIAVPTTIDEQTLRDRYQEQRARFVEPEQRLASHILIQVPANADAATEQRARDRAADLARQAREGADFADLARTHSDDIGSRNDGGDLGWIEQGLLDADFERALYALEVGGVSEPVRSSDGWHVILLRDVREGEVREFAEVRDALERELLESERERAFSELGGRLLDQTYRDPTSLAPAAEALGLELKRTGPFGRDGGTGIAANPAVIEAAFSRDVLEERNTSGPIELGPNRIVVIRVAEHEPSEPLPLAQVRDRIEDEIRAERRAEAAREQAEALLARARAGEALDVLAAEVGAELRQVRDIDRVTGGLDRAIVDEAFRLPRPAEGEVSVGSVALGGDSYVLLAVSGVRDGDPAALDATFRGALKQQLARAQSAIEVQAYIDALRRQFPVSVAEERL